MTKRLFTVTVLPLIISCSTATKSTLLGTGIGIVGGALLGSAINQNGSHDDQNKGTFIGAALGGAAGGLIGYSGYKQAEKNEAVKIHFEPAKTDSKAPQLTMPQVRRVWVPDRVIEGGTKFENGHFIYILERPSTWSPPND
jgi:hypothetical protein